MMNRRKFLKLSGGSAGSLILPSCSAKSLLFPSSDLPDLNKQPLGSHFGLATSLREEFTYKPKVEGKIPTELNGTIYRNGPGLFDRNGSRKRSLLDGDGMVQAYHIREGGVKYLNRFTKTQKYMDEQAAGEFQYATWSTQAPGGVLFNLFGGIKNQAGVSVFHKNGKLYAFNENSLPHELDPETLNTIGLSHLELDPDLNIVYNAHPKTDGGNGDWCHFGNSFGRNTSLHITIFDSLGKLKFHRKVESPRYVYLHDWFVTEKYLVFNLHPAHVNIFDFLSGQRSLIDSMEWNPDQGNLIMVLNRDGRGDPIFLETEASWMWHSLNAYDFDGTIIADFVGYQNPNHFLGEEANLRMITQGKLVENHYEGEIRRYVIDLVKKSIKQTLVDSEQNEFPIVNPSHSCHEHRFGYFVSGGTVTTSSRVKKVDFKTGKTTSFDFGQGLYCGEAIFAPKPRFLYETGSVNEPGWLLTQVYNGHTRKTFMAILDADQLDDGPVCTIHNTHHVPISFHGWWKGMS